MTQEGLNSLAAFLLSSVKGPTTIDRIVEAGIDQITQLTEPLGESFRAEVLAVAGALIGDLIGSKISGDYWETVPFEEPLSIGSGSGP